MLNVYEQLDQSKRRSSLLIFLFIAFVLGIAYFISYFYELDSSFIIFSTLFAVSYSLLSFFTGDKMVLFLNRARPAKREEYFDFYTAVENISLAAQIPMPKIYIIPSSAPNAFATGRDPKHASLAATTGLLEKLSRSELEAVVAHEIGHIGNFDIRLMMLISTLIGALSILTDIFLRSGFLHQGRKSDDDNRSSGPLAIIGFLLIILSPLIARLMQLAVSRSREFLADASSAKLTRQPAALISALEKISADPTPLQTASPTTANIYLTNPFKGKKVTNLFSTHPPIEERIRRLKEML